MTKNRLEFLSDGVFAIVITLIVLDIDIPPINELGEVIPSLLAYFLSFAVLVNFWTFHNFLFSTFSKNTTRSLAALNLLALSFVSLIPFSARLLGSFPNQPVAVSFYSIHLMILSLIFYGINQFTIRNNNVNNPEFIEINITKLDRFYGYSRIFMSVGIYILAIFISNINTTIAISLLLIPVILGVVPGLFGWIVRTLRLPQLFNIPIK